MNRMDAFEKAKMKELYDGILERGDWVSQNESEHTTQITDRVVKSEFYLCLGGAITTPGNFYLVPLETWNALESLMAKIQKDYTDVEEAKGKNYGIPWLGHLNPGFVVAVRTAEGEEFHRARILEVLKHDKFKVHFVDYGDNVTVPLNQIRYLPRKFLQVMPFQAIPATLQGTPSPPWTLEGGKFFRDLIYNRALAVQFKEKVKIEGGVGGTAWEVEVHHYSESLRRIAEFHVERHILLNCGRVPVSGTPTLDNAYVKIKKFQD